MSFLILPASPNPGSRHCILSSYACHRHSHNRRRSRATPLCTPTTPRRTQQAVHGSPGLPAFWLPVRADNLPLAFVSCPALQGMVSPPAPLHRRACGDAVSIACCCLLSRPSNLAGDAAVARRAYLPRPCHRPVEADVLHSEDSLIAIRGHTCSVRMCDVRHSTRPVHRLSIGRSGYFIGLTASPQDPLAARETRGNVRQVARPIKPPLLHPGQKEG
jgi:hypothetical protein